MDPGIHTVPGMKVTLIMAEWLFYTTRKRVRSTLAAKTLQWEAIRIGLYECAAPAATVLADALFLRRQPKTGSITGECVAAPDNSFIHNLHIVQSGEVLPAHLYCLRKETASKLDFSYSGPQGWCDSWGAPRGNRSSPAPSTFTSSSLFPTSSISL